MKKNTAIVIGGIFIIGSPIIVNILMSISSPWVKGEISDWISFYGGYIGAIIGALVAFVVTRIQIKAQEEMNKRTTVINQLPYLVMLKIEIEKIIKFIRPLINMYKLGTPAGPVENMDFKEMHEINQENWRGLEFLIDKDLIVELIKFKEEYIGFGESLKTDLKQVNTEIATINFKAEQLRKRKKPSEKDEIELLGLENQLLDLTLMHKVALENRNNAWYKIENNTLINQANSILRKINSNMSNIEEITNK